MDKVVGSTSWSHEENQISTSSQIKWDREIKSEKTNMKDLGLDEKSFKLESKEMETTKSIQPRLPLICEEYTELIAGAFSGAITRLVISPLDVMKIRFQIQIQDHHGQAYYYNYRPNYQYISILDSIAKIIKYEGVRAFWKGNLMAEFLYITYMMIQFSIYGLLQRSFQTYYAPDPSTALTPPPHSSADSPLLTKENDIKSIYLKEKQISINDHHSTASIPTALMFSFIAGAISSFVALMVSYPFDLMRTNYIVQSRRVVYHSTVHTIRKIYKSQGFSGFYRGFFPTALSLVPSMAIQFSLYNLLKGQLSSFYKVNKEAPKGLAMISLASGALAGCTSKLAVIPLDVIKRRLQVHGLYIYQNQNLENQFPIGEKGSKPKVYSPPNLISIITRMYKYEGISSFFKGTSLSIIKAGLTSALVFTTFEESKKIIQSFSLRNESFG